MRFIDAVALIEPSFGGINLEDIKAPECFMIEQTLRGTHEHPGVCMTISTAPRSSPPPA